MLSVEALIAASADSPIHRSLMALLRSNDVETLQMVLPSVSGSEEGGLDLLQQAALVAGVYGGTPSGWLEEEPAWSFFAAVSAIDKVRNERFSNLVEALIVANPQVKERHRRDVVRGRKPVLRTEDRTEALRQGLVKAPQNRLLLEQMGIQVRTADA